jgi:DNA-directed RNA polymerase specialized sigma24 family protein
MTILRDHAVVPLPHRRAVACSLTRCDRHRADDLVSDTMVNALRARHQVTPGTNRKPWPLASLRNRFYSVVGRRPAKAEVHGAKLDQLRSTPAAQAIRTVKSWVHRARERLRRMRLDEATPLGEPAIRRRAVADPIVATHAGGWP